MNIDGAGTLASNNNNQSLEISLMLFHLEDSDFLDGYSGEDYGLIERMSITVPESGDEPRTDYAFIGVDTGIIESDLLVVPEPSSYTLLAGVIALSYIASRRCRQ